MKTKKVLKEIGQYAFAILAMISLILGSAETANYGAQLYWTLSWFAVFASSVIGFNKLSSKEEEMQ